MLRNLERNIANICLGGLVVTLAVQVFYRYVLKTGLTWSEEISRFLFIWFVYVSASYAVQVGTHIRVTFFVDLFPEKIAKYIRLLADALWIGFNLAVIVSGVLLVRSMIEFPEYSSSLLVPMSLIYIVIPLAHALMIYRIIESRIRHGGKWPAGSEPQ